MSDPETLKIKQHQSVLILSIDRPKVNALDLDLVVSAPKSIPARRARVGYPGCPADRGG